MLNMFSIISPRVRLIMMDNTLLQPAYKMLLILLSKKLYCDIQKMESKLSNIKFQIISFTKHKTCRCIKQSRMIYDYHLAISKLKVHIMVTPQLTSDNQHNVFIHLCHFRSKSLEELHIAHTFLTSLSLFF